MAVLNTITLIFGERNQRLKLSVLAIAVFSLVAASRGLLSGYSYWADELHSVTASLDLWRNLYSKWLIVDVHPPLYQLVLKLWVGLFGGSELATRLLSFTCAILTMLAFALEALDVRQFRRLLALTLVGLSPSFAFYAQETRSYSMALMLATVVTLLALRLRQRSHHSSLRLSQGFDSVRLLYYCACIALSLTHYFGWIYVFSLAIINFFERKVETRRWRTCLLVALISAWPIWHLFVGGISSKTGGNFLIKATPLLGTINSYLNGCLPPLALGSSPNAFVMMWVLLLSLSLISFGSFARIRGFLLDPGVEDSGFSGESRFLLFSIVVMLAVSSAIDFHTPMSTIRNFIVLLPATALLVSNSLGALAQAGTGGRLGAHRVASILIALALVGLFFAQSYRALTVKNSPVQNFKALSAFVRESGVCSRGCFTLGSFGLHRYYFPQQDGVALEDLSLPVHAVMTGQSVSSPSINQRLEDEVGMTLRDPSLPVLGFHVASQVARDLTEQRSNAVCLQPTQAQQNSAFIVLPEKMLSGREAALGMQPCQF